MRSILAAIGPGGLAADQIDEVFRRAHSLKGAARIAEVPQVEAVAHRLETLFAKAREGTLKVGPEVVNAVHLGLDAIEDAATAAADDRPSPAPTQALEAIERAWGSAEPTTEGGAAGTGEGA